MPTPDTDADYVTFFDRELDTAGVRLVVGGGSKRRSDATPIVQPGDMGGPVAGFPPELRDALSDITGDDG